MIASKQTFTKSEIRTLGSRDLAHNLMYPGKYQFNWVLINSVWHLCSIVGVE